MLVTSGNVTEGVIFDMNILTRKACSKCGKTKFAFEFNKSKLTKSGLRSRCKLCEAEDCRIWRTEQPEKYLASGHKYRANNLEKVRAKNRKWAAENTERQRDNDLKRRAENPEKAKEQDKLSRQRHRQQRTIDQANRRALVRGNGGKVTAQEWQALKEFYGFTCLRCGRKEPEIKLTLDHVLPLVAGGKNTIDNAQCLCLSCNSSKGAKHIDYRGRQ